VFAIFAKKVSNKDSKNKKLRVSLQPLKRSWGISSSG
jgi:hypothetical protein